MLRRLLRSISPKPPPGANKTPEQIATDEALARLKRAELPTLPDLHIHLAQPAPSKEDGLPRWVKVVIALGIPAMVAEIVRRLV